MTYANCVLRRRVSRRDRYNQGLRRGLTLIEMSVVMGLFLILSPLVINCCYSLMRAHSTMSNELGRQRTFSALARAFRHDAAASLRLAEVDEAAIHEALGENNLVPLIAFQHDDAQIAYVADDRAVYRIRVHDAKVDASERFLLGTELQVKMASDGAQANLVALELSPSENSGAAEILKNPTAWRIEAAHRAGK